MKEQNKSGIEKSFEMFKANEELFEKELFAKHDTFAVLVWRVRKLDKLICIIEFLKSGAGYRIYALSDENIEEKKVFNLRQQELDF